MAQQMPIEPGATYVFDLGYYDYAWWAELDAVGCRIVTRFKSNTPLDLVEELAVPEGGDILSDRIGFLAARQAKSRRNPMQDAVREVRVTTDTGKVLRILSNDLDASAHEIADLYRRRWAIELFFRWVKQTLKITRFVGTSENAVRIQIAVALIAFLLLRLAQAAQNSIRSPLAFARLVRANLMHRRSIDYLIHPSPHIDPRSATDQPRSMLKSKPDSLGLVPGIHVLLLFEGDKDVDGRDKPGHDGGGAYWAACAGTTPEYLAASQPAPPIGSPCPLLVLDPCQIRCSA